MKKNLFRNVSVLYIASLLIFSPVFASANNGKGNGKDNSSKEALKELREETKEKKKDIKEEAKKLKQEIGNSELCGRYFNRFFTYGWMKWGSFWSDEAPINANDFEEWVKSGCNPRPRQATSTADTVAPVISEVKSMALKSLAFVSWKTNEKSDSVLYYSSSSPVNIASASKANKNALTKDHWVLVFGLNPNTTYYAVVSSRDKAGNTATSSQFSWNTGGTVTPPPADTTAPTISSISTNVDTSTITVSWNTNEQATSKVYYSTTTPLNKSLSAFVQSGTLVLNHSLGITNLSTSTTYYLVVESTDSSVNTATSSELTATTTSGI